MLSTQTKLLLSQFEVPEHVKNVFGCIWGVCELLDARKSQKICKYWAKSWILSQIWSDMWTQIVQKTEQYWQMFWLLRASRSSQTPQMHSKTFLTCSGTSNWLRSYLVCVESNYLLTILKLKKALVFFEWSESTFRFR